MVRIPKHVTSQCYREIDGKIHYKLKHRSDTEAIDEAKRLNSLPKTIHKVIAYKCAICGYFHVGKSWKELHNKNNIYNGTNNR